MWVLRVQSRTPPVQTPKSLPTPVCIFLSAPHNTLNYVVRQTHGNSGLLCLSDRAQALPPHLSPFPIIKSPPPQTTRSSLIGDLGSQLEPGIVWGLVPLR